MNSSPPRRGAVAHAVLGVGFVLLAVVLVLHMVRFERMGRLHRLRREHRARWLARSALEHAVDGTYRRLDRIDELCRHHGGDVALDEVAADITEGMTCVAVPFDEGRAVGFYRVVSLRVRRRAAHAAAPWYVVKVKGEGRIDARPDDAAEPLIVEEEGEFLVRALPGRPEE